MPSSETYESRAVELPSALTRAIYSRSRHRADVSHRAATPSCSGGSGWIRLRRIDGGKEMGRMKSHDRRASPRDVTLISAGPRKQSSSSLKLQSSLLHTKELAYIRLHQDTCSLSRTAEHCPTHAPSAIQSPSHHTRLA